MDVAETVLDLVNRAIAKLGSQRAVAIALDVDDSTISKIVREETDNLAWENLLRLSDEVDMSPSDVLKIAGKGEVAKLIERYYGPPQKMSPLARALAEVLQEPHPEKKRTLEDLAEGYVKSLRDIQALLPPESSAPYGHADDGGGATGKRASRLPQAK